MAKPDKDRSELIVAAEALDRELRTFEEIVRSSSKAPLNSQKNLERAANLLTEVAQCHDRLGGAVQTLIGAITAARDWQQGQAEAVQARAEQIKARTEEYQGLLDRYQALGENAAQLNKLMNEIVSSPEKEDAIATRIDEIHNRILRVAEDAQELARIAQEKDFADVGRQADSLRQQLISVRGKVSQLQKRCEVMTLLAALNLLGSMRLRQAAALEAQGPVQSPMEVICPRPVLTPEILRLQDRGGTVERGKLADLLVVLGGPPKDLRLFQSPENRVLIMKGGVVFKRRVAHLPTLMPGPVLKITGRSRSFRPHDCRRSPAPLD